MRHRFPVACCLTVLMVASGFGTAAAAQVSGGGGAAAGDRGPRFLVALSPSKRPMPIDVARTPALRRRVSIELDNVPLDDALKRIATLGGFSLSYSTAMIPYDRLVRLKATDITVAAALTEVLLNADVDVLFSNSTQAILVARPVELKGVPTSVGTITGTVSDARTGARLAAIDVALDGTRWRTVTDSSGRYRLSAIEAGSYTVVFRRIGYAKQRRPVRVVDGGEDTVDVTLDAQASRLDELVSTATGQRRRVDIANDITTINADSVMQTAPIRSVTDLLETRVPGLTVQRTSGAPGDPARLRIRGAGSPLHNNDPIVIVDGVRFYANQSAQRSQNLALMRPDTTAGIGFVGSQAPTSYATPSPLDYIDPNSIETIEVIKGPSAATLYGQDAANGVIVITTKRGKAGPTRWTANFERGRTAVSGDFPNLWIRWGHRSQQDGTVWCPVGDTALFQNALGVVSPAPCTADSLVQYQLLNDQTLTPLGPGNRTSASLGASGGNATFDYSITGSYQYEVGLPKLPSYEVDRYVSLLGSQPPDWMDRPQHLGRWGVVGNFHAKLGRKADVTLTTNFSRTAQQRSSLETNLGMLQGVYIDRASGTYYTNSTLPEVPLSGESTTQDYLSNYYQRVQATAIQFTNGVAFTWRAYSWFTVTADAGLNLEHQTGETFIPAGLKGLTTPTDSGGQLNTGQGSIVGGTMNLRGLALVPLGRGFQGRVAIGANYTGTSINDQALQSAQLAVGTSNLGRFITGAHATQDDATFGWYVEPSVGNSKINFTAGLRLDGGSGFGANVGGLSLPTFPKLGFSYLLSDEPWFPFKSTFQSFRIRTAFGKASRQPSITEKLRVYSSAQSQYADGGYNNAVYLASLGNTELRPERNTEFEGGFDADLFDSRVNVQWTGYHKVTDDAILSKQLPPSVTGDFGPPIFFNIGQVKNTGMDLTVGAQLLRSKLVTWSTNVSLSWQRNIVVDLGAGVDPFYTTVVSSQDGVPGYGTRVAEGYPLYGTWAQSVVGYAEVNGRTTLIYGDTAVYVGQPYPNYEANFGTTIGLWRSAVQVSAQFSYQNGLGQTNRVTPGVMSRILNDSTLTGSELTLSEIGTGPSQTVDIFRFQSLGISYRVPPTFARRIGAQDLSVQLQGSNLGLATNYTGLDPNVNGLPVGNSVIDNGVLPLPRTWQLRVSANY